MNKAIDFKIYLRHVDYLKEEKDRGRKNRIKAKLGRKIVNAMRISQF